ncbi:acetyl-CoA carboxylase biotin carboxylase subunit [Candidatus Bipolaricaulota bacterium]|nr:acetyl-CoA carboxylase biotin carboxylase subunit [Candidatus Bipolaricaulota bacterium]
MNSHFETVLVANRGEIAVRVIEACRELGLRSVAAYSQADAAMPYLKLADESICIGPGDASRSYLNIAAIISAAELTGAGAIHPGYGFLAENPHFVEVCEEHDLTFIGPPREVMELCGNKSAARRAADEAGVPVLPGVLLEKGASEAAAAAESIGFPLLVKAVYGGGGRGMRWIASPDELAEKVAAAAEEAQAASGDASLYLERAVETPRHIEVQIIAGPEGDLIHLGERDCSIQRRHQKLIEESPAPNLDDDLRNRLHRAALATARAVGYRNAGTVEFLLADDGAFYFIEMNARIQVEHSVSEVVSGTNLIKEQIRIAAGETLSMRQEDVRPRGHAIECRLNAEDPTRGFLPSCGTVRIEQLPGGNGVRLDTAIYNGMEILPYYDSLIAKLITWGKDRDEARIRMVTALQRFRLSGIATTRDVMLAILRLPEFRRGEVDTGMLERLLLG